MKDGLLRVECAAIAVERGGGGEVGLEVGGIDALDAGAHGNGEEGEERIDGEIPGDGCDEWGRGETSVHGENALLDARDGFDVVVAVGHGEDGEDARTGLRADDLQAFFAGGAVGDSQVATETGVDVIHHLPESSAVGGGVVDLIVSDVVVDHLMDDGVLEFGFIEIEALAYTQPEIREMLLAKEPNPLLADHLPHIRARVR